MDKKDFKDLFSTQANLYSQYRPTYPKELYDYLFSISPNLDLAWDCGTGNGQAAVELATKFKKVIATDPSEKQISEAKNASNIVYEVGKAENFSFDHSELEGKVSLITVAQAFHWFNHKEFSVCVDKVLQPSGHLAVWTYAVANITPEIDLVVEKLYSKILNGYWEKERSLVDEGYKSIVLPFKDCVTPKFELSAEWTLEHLVGYLNTWSAVQTYIKKNNHNPLEDIYSDLQLAWGRQIVRTIKWPLSLRVFKK